MRIRLAALCVLLLAAAPAAAQTAADQVKDRESLKAFVLDAKRYLENLTDYNDVIAMRETLRQQPRWASGDTYLMFDGS